MERSEGIQHPKKFFDRRVFHPFRVEKKELSQRASLEDVAIQATFDSNRSIDPSVQEIDLGKFFDDAEALAQKTINDPRHRERGFLIRIRKRFYRKPTTKVRKILHITSQYSKAVIETYNIAPFLPRIAANFSDEMSLMHLNNVGIKNTYFTRLASSLHTHPIDVPPSITDVIPVLATNRDSLRATFGFVSAVDARTMTPGRKYLIFRGPNTPQMTRKELQDFEEKFTKLAGFKPHDQAISEVQSRSTNVLTQLLAEDQSDNTLQYYFILGLAKKYDLRVFIAQAGKKIAKLTELDPQVVDQLNFSKN